MSILINETFLRACLKEQDYIEIENMPVPNESQVKYVKEIFEKQTEARVADQYKLDLAIINFKLYLKCKESCPEYFI